MDIESMLLPHYGVIEKDKIRIFLERSEAVTRQTAQKVMEMVDEGKNREEMLAFFTERDYREWVRPAYPMDAFCMNTGIMIEQVKKELIEKANGEAEIC